VIAPTWFLYISGFGLIILGALQIQARPRQRGDSPFQRFVNVGTLWSLVCITVGALVVAMALGYWSPWPPAPRAPEHSRRHR
jgi:hypothetical protein